MTRFGQKPIVDHFRIFGCVTCVHVRYSKKKKLNAKGEKCVVLGVNKESKAYRLCKPITKRICISIDVVFDENNWNWENNHEGKLVALELEGNEEAGSKECAHSDGKETNKSRFGGENEVALHCKLCNILGEVQVEWQIILMVKSFQTKTLVRHGTIRMVISLAAMKEWTIFQLDDKSAFLHGELVEQPHQQIYGNTNRTSSSSYKKDTSLFERDKYSLS
ncbi:hypothetical protein CR513_18329, partial [Mucuna pruriens]